jgi:hypothetical protein
MSDTRQHRRLRWDPPFRQAADHAPEGTAPRLSYPMRHQPGRYAGARPSRSVGLSVQILDQFVISHKTRPLELISLTSPCILHVAQGARGLTENCQCPVGVRKISAIALP